MQALLIPKNLYVMKKQNDDNFNSASSWANNTVPTLPQIATYNNNLTSTTTDITNDISIGGIRSSTPISTSHSIQQVLSSPYYLYLDRYGMFIEGSNSNFNFNTNLATLTDQVWSTNNTIVSLNGSNTTTRFSAGTTTTIKTTGGEFRFGSNNRTLTGSGNVIFDSEGTAGIISFRNLLGSGSSSTGLTGNVHIKRGVFVIGTSIPMFGSGNLIVGQSTNSPGQVGFASSSLTQRYVNLNNPNVTLIGHITASSLYPGVGAGTITFSNNILLSGTDIYFNVTMPTTYVGLYLSGIVSGSSNINISGFGIVAIDNNINTCSGNIVINSSGSGGLAIWQNAIANCASVTLLGAGKLYLGKNGSSTVQNLSSASSTTSISTAFNISSGDAGAPRSLTINQSSNATFEGTVVDNVARPLSIIKENIGNLNNTNLWSHRGSTTIQNGSLIFAEPSGNITTTSGITVDLSGIFEWSRIPNATFSIVFTGYGTVKKTVGSGNLIFAGINSSFFGNWHCVNGNIGFQSDSNVGATGVDAADIILDGGGFFFSTTGQTLHSSRTVTITSNNGILNGSTGHTGVFDALFTGPGLLTKVSGSTATLTNSNNYTGGTNINTGTIIVGNTNALGTGTVTVNSGGTLNLNGFTIPNTIVNNGGTIIP